MQVSQIDTPVGPLLAEGDDEFLYSLDFRVWLGDKMGKKTRPILSIERELQEYFHGTLKKFHTPIKLIGTPFQIRVWEELQRIPYGECRAYSDIAGAIGKPTAARAVARANATNKLPILIPCHRVIQRDGKLGGYTSGIPKKKFLLNLEKVTI